MTRTIRAPAALAAAERIAAGLAVAARRGVLLGAAALAGCSSGPADEAPVTVTSDSGALRVTLEMSPQPIQRGVDSAELTISDAGDGGSAAGLTLAITPWMPAMDHGTSVVPTVTDLGGGHYRVTNLVLYMAGHWELRIAIGGDPTGAASTDHATPAVDVP